MLCLASGFAHAALVEIPALNKRVTDLTQTLSQSQQAQLEDKLAAFERKKGSQIAVLIIPTTQPEDIAQYSIRAVEKWKIGRKKVDDGLLILVAKDDHKMRIEVGYGLEGAIPDLTAKRGISEVIAPKFKQGDFFGGIDSGVDKLIGLVDGEPLPEPGSPAFSGKTLESLLPMLLFGALITGLFLLYNTVICILLAYFSFREARRTDQKVYRVGFQAIAFGFIANLLIFVFFLVDSILIMLDPGSAGYSVFISIGWIMAFLTAFLFYLGYILPPWFRKRIEEKS